MGLLISDTSFVKMTDFVAIGIYEALRPEQFAEMPPARAKELIRAGRAEAVKKVPAGAKVAKYSESDFLPRPIVKPPEPRTREQIMEANRWDAPQWEAAQGCGFPPAGRSVYKHIPGQTTATLVLLWDAEALDRWRNRIVSLRLK